jgi:hypothetical protein
MLCTADGSRASPGCGGALGVSWTITPLGTGPSHTVTGPFTTSCSSGRPSTNIPAGL